MERTRVRSSSIASLGYDDALNQLEVEFVDGGVYRYFLVPRLTYEGLLVADSVGRAFNERVRGRFRYEECTFS